MNFKDKINHLKKMENYISYTLNNKNIELINLINDFRTKNNLDKLNYSILERLSEFFNQQNSQNEKYLFKYQKDKFKFDLLNNTQQIIEILLIQNLKYIIILESDNKEYIFIYSDKPKIKSEYKYLKISNNKINNKIAKFKIVNNIIAENKLETLNFSYSKNMYKVLRNSLYNEGFQIYTLKYDTLFGVMEGPPNTSYENGYFLFKMIFPNDFHFKPPLFSFITKIFHPNISENGVLSVDVFQEQHYPALVRLCSIVYSVMSLLDDPNPDIFINEIAAKLYKENKNEYEKTVKEYTSLFANYSIFQKDLKNLNLNYEVI